LDGADSIALAIQGCVHHRGNLLGRGNAATSQTATKWALLHVAAAGEILQAGSHTLPGLSVLLPEDVDHPATAGGWSNNKWKKLGVGRGVIFGPTQ
jgi:hypothetical protein